MTDQQGTSPAEILGFGKKPGPSLEEILGVASSLSSFLLEFNPMIDEYINEIDSIERILARVEEKALVRLNMVFFDAKKLLSYPEFPLESFLYTVSHGYLRTPEVARKWLLFTLALYKQEAERYIAERRAKGLPVIEAPPPPELPSA